MDVSAAQLAPLAASVDAARRLSARRGYLHDSESNRRLAEMLRERPRDFGAAGHIVLGADAVEPYPGARGFSDALWIMGLECIDGFQRLKIIANSVGHLPSEHLDRSVLRLEIVCGPDRERVRRVHDDADSYVNVSTAQDRLIRCPNIVRLMRCDWERGDFDPRRGITTGPHRLRLSMADMTRALACLSTEQQPDAAHLSATDEGLDELWGDPSSPVYRSLFHERMTPVGVMRAVEAWQAARGALAALPQRRHEGHGHLIPYAPVLICWAACRALPLRQLHDPRPPYAWEHEIEHHLPGMTVSKATELVELYGASRPKGKRPYKAEAPELDLWLELAELSRRT
ncbi:hypothetical protein [Streptomyces sp. SID3343]|uniref:hypothetical protein n=1 Tax=Streptomyces sp. SID3343 TaxID=2690260 RepID=UPI00136C07F1|nr:hypothetical protein [Streptomyces sp. SID3343]MYV98855.1 hypothetical protein [Streptomyces sp. SID3343]